MPRTVRDGRVAPIFSSIFGQINDESTNAPSDGYLGFDPSGLPEWAAFVRHPWDALKAKKLGNEADTLTRKLYPDDPSNPGLRHNDAADAFLYAAITPEAEGLALNVGGGESASLAELDPSPELFSACLPPSSRHSKTWCIPMARNSAFSCSIRRGQYKNRRLSLYRLSSAHSSKRNLAR